MKTNDERIQEFVIRGSSRELQFCVVLEDRVRLLEEQVRKLMAVGR